MSELANIFMPGARHWDEVKRAEKMLLVDSKQGGSGPDPLDLDEGYMVLRDRTGSATQASTDIGTPNRVRVRKQEDGTHKSAADDISAMPPAAYSND